MYILRFFFLLALFIVCFSSCKEKKKPVAPPPPVIEKKKPVTPPPPPEVKEEPVKKPDEGVNINHSYFIVVNSYTVPEFANEKRKLWKEKGFKPMVIMRNDDGYYRLVIKSFEEYSEAILYCLEFRKENETSSDAWVMFRSTKAVDFSQ